MPSRSPSRTTWAVALLLVASVVACDGCRGKNPAAPPGAPATAVNGGPTSDPAGFAEQSARLASLPAGHELGEARFSADGHHVAFVANKDGSAFVFLDATKYGPYQDARELVFPGGRRGLAFVARRGGKESVVAGGVEGAGYAGIGKVLFAPDGRVVYSASQDDRWRVVVGTREAVVPGASDPAPFVSPDGKRVIFAEQRAETGMSSLRACSLELTDCVAGGAFDGITSLKTDRSGRVLAFAASKDGKQTIATVGLDTPGLAARTAGWFDAVAHFATSDGGEHLAFLARRGESHLLVKDGKELPIEKVDSPLDLVVSRNGRVLLTAVVGNKVLAFVDGKRIGREQEGLYSPTFSPDGTSYAIAAGGESKNVVVVNGEEGPLFDKVVTPRFTPDGTRIVYRARNNGERFAVVADAHGKTLREHPHYEAVFDVVFSPDGKSVGYGVRTGQELWWKVEKL